MRYAFVMDQGRCIGCHACTVACKAEHDVPLGANRTWVKYVEKGEFPEVRRHFAVLRCNHCEAAPCVTICPVTALHRRDDGIVDVDRDVCIGCKACMQACPYDALYIHPDRGVAEKCNFCAHRVEVGLEPPCATVCPAEAIVVGDLDDPASRVAQIVATKPVDVRKPEKGTVPKVFYLDAEPRALVPGAADPSGGYLWADRPGGGNGGGDGTRRPPEPTGWASATPARTTYDVGHERPWGWRVSAYLWTKSIAAGAFLVAALAGALGVGGAEGLGPPALAIGLPAVGLVFLALTTALLVLDLKRPERFLLIVTRPNWDSWVARGAFVLMGFGLLGAAWAGAAVVGASGALDLLRWPLVAAAVAAAGYSGYLFAQAKGRDFWQSPLLPAHLVVQAAVAGVAAAILLQALAGGPTGRLGLALVAGLVVHLGFVVFGEVTVTHPSRDAERAARALTSGPLKGLFAAALLVAAVSALLAAVGGGLAIAALGALVALALYEHAWLLAGQIVPLS